MERVFPLQGLNGQLLVREDGVRAELLAEAEDTGAGLYKGYAAGPGGRLLLGTFVPEEGRLRLRRSVSRRELEQAGCWPVEGGEAVLAFSFGGQKGPPKGWQRENTPGRLMGEPLLAAAAPGPALVRQERNGFSLAYPYGPDKPFPLTPVFCFARLEELDGRPYLCFPFRPGGCPRLEALEEL